MEAKWETMAEELAKLTGKQLRRIARDEGICMGNEGGTKDNMVRCIVVNRRYREMNGYEQR